MKKRRANDTDQSYCFANGIIAYPIKVGNDWYIELDNNGQKKRFPKSISNAYVLKGINLQGPMNKVYSHYANLLKKHEARQENSDQRTNHQGNTASQKA